MNKSSLDAGIPLLTEVITTPQVNPASAQAGQAAAAAHPTPKDKVQAPPAAATAKIDSWVDAEWTRMERQISERVLQQMMGRVDFVLEQRVRDSLADVLQVAVTGLASEIRAGLQQTLEEVIARAVSQEIIRLQSNKK